MAVAVGDISDEESSFASLDARRAALGRRRRVGGMRQWVSLGATVCLVAWLATVVVLTVVVR